MSFYRNLCLAIVLLASHSLAFLQTQESQTEPISSALRAGEFDKAVELSRSALQTSPNNAQLWVLQGIAYVSKGEGKEGLTSFAESTFAIAPRGSHR